MPRSLTPEIVRRLAARMFVRYLILAVIIFAAILGGLLAVAGMWPPLVAVDSGSMAHGIDASSFGVIDVGDIVISQSVSSRSEIITYLEGRASGYATYGDFGDAIIFPEPGIPDSPYIIHRALAYVVYDPAVQGYEVPDLARLQPQDWSAWDVAGQPTTNTTGLSRFVLHDAGWRHDIDVTFDRARVLIREGNIGFLTMGDDNLYSLPTQIDPWILSMTSVVARARGEIPWFGLVKLTLFPGAEGCCSAWGSTDPELGAPANSWLALDLSIALLIGAPTAWAALDFLRKRLRRTRAQDALGGSLPGSGEDAPSPERPQPGEKEEEAVAPKTESSEESTDAEGPERP